MADKIIKQIKTSCPFPVLIYKTNVTYNEVRKASGIAYILLELIEKSVDADEKISNVLLKFGIPSDLHYIFGNELAWLMSTEIVESVYPAEHFRNARYFPQIYLNELSLTDKGRKLFREGAIPTGAEKTKVKDIYFSPVNRRFSVDWSLPHIDIATSSIGCLVDTVKPDISGMEDYVAAHPSEMGIKAEERIVSVIPEEPRWERTGQEENMTVSVTGDGVSFTFETSDEKAFFDRYYSSSLVKDIMLIKQKYKFYKDGEAAIVPTMQFEDLRADTLYIPDDIKKQANRPCKLFIARGMFDYERTGNTVAITGVEGGLLLDIIDKNAEFALLDNSGCRYYRALNIAFPCAQFGDTFEMQWLVENKAEDDITGDVLQAVFEKYKVRPLDDECGKVVLFIAEAMRSHEYFAEYAEERFNGVNSVDEKIKILLQLNAVFLKSEIWRPLFMEHAKSFFTGSVGEIKLDNMIYKDTVLSLLKKEMCMTDSEYIRSFVQNVIEEEPTLICQALEAAGFRTNEILGVVNVVEIYMQAVLDNGQISAYTKLAPEYNVLRINLWKLNDMLGIKSYSDYTIKDDYNVDEFFDVYGTFDSKYKSLQKFKSYAVRQYDELKRYLDIYSPIHDLLSIERTSSSHPEKITAEYVDTNISRGKYKEAICDLLVKLQYDLRKALDADSATPCNELIDEAKNQGVIDGRQVSILHKLRMCRNGFQHPERTQISYDEQIITEWEKIVFSLTGDKE